MNYYGNMYVTPTSVLEAIHRDQFPETNFSLLAYHRSVGRSVGRPIHYIRFQYNMVVRERVKANIESSPFLDIFLHNNIVLIINFCLNTHLKSVKPMRLTDFTCAF